MSGNENDESPVSEPTFSTSNLPDRFIERFINDKAENMRHAMPGEESADDKGVEPASAGGKSFSNPNSPVDVFIQMSADANEEG